MRRHRKRHDKPSSRVTQSTIYFVQSEGSEEIEEVVEEVAYDDSIGTVELQV